MEARATDCSSNHGIAWWFLDAHDPSYSTNSEWLARTSDGIYFLVLTSLGPAPTLTFRPSYMTQEWSVDYTLEFDKLLKRVDVIPQVVNAVRRSPTGLVEEYCLK